MEFIILAFIVIGFVGLAFYLKKPQTSPEHQFEEKEAKILALEKQVSERDTTITNLTKELEIEAVRQKNFNNFGTIKKKI